ncbi:MAG TPA: VOC family protein [Gemmatimonadaceae bacterium]|nr:VOC family protein [Gemmatimonadaceae bacterium]
MTAPAPGVRLDTLGQIALTVTDVERATAYYRDTLGLPFLFAFPGLAFFRLGDVRLMLTRPDDADPRSMASPLYFRVRDIQRAHETLAARGVAFVDAPHVVHRDDTMTLWMAFFRDPDGNLMAIMEEEDAGRGTGDEGRGANA